MKKSLYKFNLYRLFSNEIQGIEPSRIVKNVQFGPKDAVLCWGKAAPATWEALGNPPVPNLILSLRSSEHPFPGPGSFKSGAALLEFFEGLGRTGIRRLTVYLSGGASSLAWIRPADLKEEDLLQRLWKLYRSGCDIAELNRERSRLCALKGGGSARWLRKLAPHVRAKVEIISDVDPYGAEVVGSGPFWVPGISHRILMSNRGFVRRLARSSPVPVLEAEGGLLGTPESWVKRIESYWGRSGLVILGGEPQIQVRGKGRGGRMTHLAAMLALRFPESEILCASTDGTDGNSGASGAWIRPGIRLNPRHLRAALRRFDSAAALGSALFQERPTGTNVQDVVLVRL